jgi:hypothetical protein
MRKLVFLAFWLAVAPLAVNAAPSVNANLATPQEANALDRGCLGGNIGSSRFPTQTYDPVTRERIMYNISRCTGGFIMGTSTDTWKSWHADIHPGGSMTGQDVDGSKWSYDQRTKLYTNQTTGRTCSEANLRHICAQ